MDELIKKDLDQIIIAHKGIIPETINDVVNALNGLGSLLTASDWYRSAVVRAFTEKGKGGPRTAREIVQLSIREFAEKGIKGLKTQDAVRFYYDAWESLDKPKPMPGEEIILPDIPFPEWSTDKPTSNLFTGNNEWFTPKIYIEKARLVMGSIDVDPASNIEAQKIVKAKIYYTIETNGLDKEWHGNIWMNPPYSGKEIIAFIDKLILEWNLGHIKQAIVLTNNSTDTSWFHNLTHKSEVICLTKGRIPFYNGDEIASPLYGQAFFYLGRNNTKFIDEFTDTGLIIAEIK